MKRETVRPGTVFCTPVVETPVQNIEEEAQSLLQTIPGLSCNIRNSKQYALRTPVLQACLSGFEIPDAVKYIENRSLILVFSRSIGDSERILVFFPQAFFSSFDYFESSANCASGDTFKKSPSLWSRIFTLHITIRGPLVSRLFSLIHYKKEFLRHQIVCCVGYKARHD